MIKSCERKGNVLIYNYIYRVYINNIIILYSTLGFERSIKMDRKEVLLRACYDLLMRQVESGYVLNLLDEIIHYDDTDVDGTCLLEDIRYELELEG